MTTTTQVPNLDETIGEEETAKLTQELATLQATFDERGHTAAQAKRTKEIRRKLGLDSGSKGRGGNGAGSKPATTRETAGRAVPDAKPPTKTELKSLKKDVEAQLAATVAFLDGRFVTAGDTRTGLLRMRQSQRQTLKAIDAAL